MGDIPKMKDADEQGRINFLRKQCQDNRDNRFI